MTVLSDTGIKTWMSQGRIAITPFDEALLGPISYDLTLDRLFVNKRHPSEEQTFEEFLEQCCKPINWQLIEPGELYYGVSKETIHADNTCMPEVTARSSMARAGLKIAVDYADFLRNYSRVPFIIKAVSGGVVIPLNRPIAQLTFKCSLPLDIGKLTEALATGDISVSGNPKVYWENKTFPMNGFGYFPTPYAILLHLGSSIKRFKGGVLNPLESTEQQFEKIDVSQGYVLKKGEFYLGYTQETVMIGRKHAGRLVRFSHSYGSEVHLNAPWIQPGSSGNQVLEMTVLTDSFIKAGQPICGMEIHPLDQPVTKPYNGRYMNQEEALTSKLNA